MTVSEFYIYFSIPILDHNKTHAADVLHAVSYLLFEIIPEFSHEFANDGGERERKVTIKS